MAGPHRQSRPDEAELRSTQARHGQWTTYSLAKEASVGQAAWAEVERLSGETHLAAATGEREHGAEDHKSNCRRTLSRRHNSGRRQSWPRKPKVKLNRLTPNQAAAYSFCHCYGHLFLPELLLLLPHVWTCSLCQPGNSGTVHASWHKHIIQLPTTRLLMPHITLQRKLQKTLSSPGCMSLSCLGHGSDCTLHQTLLHRRDQHALPSARRAQISAKRVTQLRRLTSSQDSVLGPKVQPEQSGHRKQSK